MQRRVWFHRSRAIVWVFLTLAALRWWPTSVAFVIIMSGYANVVSDWTASEAADNSAILHRLAAMERRITAAMPDE
jgi:hypothetical protein